MRCITDILDTLAIPALCLCLLSLLSGCTSTPKNINDSCAIFEEKDDWYDDAMDSYEKWGAPVELQLSIIYQESRFEHDAKPPRDTLLWVIPWFRKSSAFGYAQAVDGTWDAYVEDSGNWGADRDDFEDVTDFIGWYVHTSHRKLGIAKNDAYRQYLAYHEGHLGYRRKTYANKPWLMKTARRVQKRANVYRVQLTRCEEDLSRGWSLWPF